MRQKQFPTYLELTADNSWVKTPLIAV